MSDLVKNILKFVGLLLLIGFVKALFPTDPPHSSNKYFGQQYDYTPVERDYKHLFVMEYDIDSIKKSIKEDTSLHITNVVFRKKDSLLKITIDPPFDYTNEVESNVFLTKMLKKHYLDKVRNINGVGIFLKKYPDDLYYIYGRPETSIGKLIADSLGTH